MGLSEHAASDDATVTIPEGEYEVRVAGQAHQMKEEKTIILPAYAPLRLLYTLVQDESHDDTGVNDGWR